MLVKLAVVCFHKVKAGVCDSCFDQRICFFNVHKPRDSSYCVLEIAFHVFKEDPEHIGIVPMLVPAEKMLEVACVLHFVFRNVALEPEFSQKRADVHLAIFEKPASEKLEERQSYVEWISDNDNVFPAFEQSAGNQTKSSAS